MGSRGREREREREKWRDCLGPYEKRRRGHMNINRQTEHSHKSGSQRDSVPSSIHQTGNVSPSSLREESITCNTSLTSYLL